MPSDAPRPQPPRRGFPWAGVLAIALVLVADRVLLGPCAPWETLHARIPVTERQPWEISRRALKARELANTPADHPRILVLGSSRAQWGFRSMAVAPWRLDSLAIVRLAHPGLGIYEVGALAREMIRYAPDVVVLILSEMDTHVPPRLEPVSAKAVGTLGTAFDIAVAAGPSFALTERETLLRLALVGVLNGYRYRRVIQAAGADTAREFLLDDRLSRFRAKARADPGYLDFGERTRSVTHAEAQEILVRLREQFPEHRGLELVAPRLTSVGMGRHVTLQLGLLERAIGVVLESGARVVLVEGPLHPVAREFYDPATRDEFTAFASRLAHTPGISFVRLEDMPPFHPTDFRDPIHLDATGTTKLTGAILDAIYEALGRPPPSPPPPGTRPRRGVPPAPEG